MAGKELDNIVRPNYKHLLESSYPPFPFSDLPVELALHILLYAAGCSQGTYRSLLLTKKRISDLARIETLSRVPIILTSEAQFTAFQFYLTQRPEVIPHIHYLWTISPGSVRGIFHTAIFIINTCTSIRSLACHPHILLGSICAARATESLRHTQCVDLTMIEFRVAWSHVMTRSGATFFHQLDRLHFIGALNQVLWATSAVIPKLDNLTRASIAMGSHRNITKSLFAQVVESPKLQQVVITTHLHGDGQQALADEAQDIDHRFSVMHRRRRWKETKFWHESLQDRDRFWKQAKEEKDKPPVPRPLFGHIQAA
ncbi:hypothetical protein B0H10DRAFT_2026228 [Mycena sp. CBHHK59/15]|nr:hypothetical protein B0H10DRAFT_2026228 [Mycena sp. CBHHK59/15]